MNRDLVTSRAKVACSVLGEGAGAIWSIGVYRERERSGHISGKGARVVDC